MSRRKQLLIVLIGFLLFALADVCYWWGWQQGFKAGRTPITLHQAER